MDTFAEALAALLGRLASIEGPLVVVVSRILVVLAAVGLASVGYRAGSRLIDKLLRPLEGASDYPVKVQRARTLGPLMKSVTRYALAFMALMVTLREVGVDIRALLVSAGVLGLAVGLGAQSLIKDVITGFFILFEGLIAVGDVIEVGSHVGTGSPSGCASPSSACSTAPSGRLTAAHPVRELQQGGAGGAGRDRGLRRERGAPSIAGQLARRVRLETGLARGDPRPRHVRFGDGKRACA